MSVIPIPNVSRPAGNDRAVGSPDLVRSTCRPVTLRLVSVPVAAGFPSPAADHQEQAFDLADYLVQNPAATFVMRAKGESMREHGILDGALLVVDRSIQPSDGKIVVAALNGEHCVKRFRRRGRRMWLEAGNPDFPEIELQPDDDFTVFGVVRHIVNTPA